MQTNDPIKEIKELIELEVSNIDRKLKILNMSNFKRKDVEFTLLIVFMNSPIFNKISYNIKRNEIYIFEERWIRG